ncbi:hypothetical protein ASD83_12380 [Devosia sp. Root685]|uniref:hypothetical protein n=1 Tax=Devosia sp. Root685 TaxID=1736587 RepID=UPI0006F49173|nr:hypothetical protein [Devosia sp. Root685]KRA97869.1 hypothetical protein ASD83_12380 [Devosia sp. Root685]
MEMQSQVFDVEVEFDGQTHKAAYFVENGVIHAQVEGKLIVSPLGAVPASKTVKALVTGQLLQLKRRHKQRISWAQ